MGYIRTADNTARLAFEGSANNREIVNVFYVNTDEEDFSQENIVTVVTQAIEVWQDSVLDVLPDQYLFAGVHIMSLDTNDPFSFFFPALSGHNVNGQSAGNSLPPNCAYLVNKQPDEAPRGFRPGRVYLLAGAEATVNEAGVLDAAVVSGVNSVMAALQAVLHDPSGPLSNRHVVPSWPGLLSPPPVEPTPVEASEQVRVGLMTCSPILATQRRRMR